ncbi:MAG: redoxin domain-containing protein [Planctomycetes bacterium]|nr:redoxin domain-containing protein [Planctomycetota bacterium]
MRVLLMALLIAASPLVAGDLKVGDEAPKFRAGGVLVNPPEFARSLEDCRGDVIVIFEWHTRDGTAAKLPDLQKYWEKYGENGLMIFTIHRLDFEKLPQVRQLAHDRKLTFPIAMGGFYDDKNEFFKYKGDSGFRTAVIDVEGKIAYHGAGDFKPALDTELAKIVYPNLGRHAVTESAAKVARGLQKREWGKVLADAEKLLATELDADTKADLQVVADRLKFFAEARIKRIEGWTADKRYDLVMKTLDKQREDFRGHKFSDDAKDEIARLKKDKDLKKELKAWEDLQKLKDKQEFGDWQQYVTSLNAFAKSQAGTGAATHAESEAKRVKNEWSEQ